MMHRRPIFAATAFWVCLGALMLAVLWHISVGAKAIAIGTVIDALVSPQDGVFDHAVVRDLRLPRAVFSVAVGAALSVAGALMQGVTRNPLAEPGILGLMVGASFSVIICIGWLNLASLAWVPFFAAVGALGGAVLVWGMASAVPGGATPLTLILSGAAVTTFLGAIEGAVILLNEDTFEDFRLWLSGSLAGRSMDAFLWAAPWFVLGLGAALAISRQITALSMGEETAAGLGINTLKVKALALLAVVMLTGAAVSVAGPLGFVGLVIPHLVRLFVGSDYRLIVPFSAIIGGCYVVLVDIAARVLLAPIEISTGIVTTMLGAPVFIWLVRARL